MSRIQLMGGEEAVFVTGTTSDLGTTKASLVEWAQRKAKRFGECRILGRDSLLAIVNADGSMRTFF